mgnify:CR=1 FL=1
MPSARFGVPSKGWWLLLSTLLVLCGNSVWGLEDKSLVRIHSAERNLYDSLHAFGYTYSVITHHVKLMPINRSGSGNLPPG